MFCKGFCEASELFTRLSREKNGVGVWRVIEGRVLGTRKRSCVGRALRGFERFLVLKYCPNVSPKGGRQHEWES